MIIFDWILYILVFGILIFTVVAKIKKLKFKYDVLLYLAPLLFSALHILVCGLNYFLVPIMLSTLFIFLLCPARKRWFTFVPVLLVSLTLAAATFVIPGSEGMLNYASMTYTESFSQLNAYLQNTYPLANHKNIDFNAKYNEFLPLFESAQQNNDKKAYFNALTAYIASFSDAHMMTAPADAFIGLTFSTMEYMGWRQEDFGGDIGFAAIRTDDGRALAVGVDINSEAYAQGVRNGSEILTYNGKTPDDAASVIPMVFAPQSSADAMNRLTLQYLMLGRCPVGQSVTITYREDDATIKELTVVAKENSFRTMKDTFDTVLGTEPESEADLYSFQMLSDETAYIRIASMMFEKEVVVLEQMKADLQSLALSKGKNLIIDLRQNGGGEDAFAAKIKAFFTTEADFYLTESILDPKTNTLIPQETINVTPDPTGFNGQIILLVNAGSASAAEGFAYNMAELDNVTIAGMMGTNGSFGTLSDGFVLLPENFVLLFPRIACIDENGQVMIDTDASGYGGVKPDMKIPIDDNAVRVMFDEKKDYELNYVLENLA